MGQQLFVGIVHTRARGAAAVPLSVAAHAAALGALMALPLMASGDLPRIATANDGIVLALPTFAVPPVVAPPPLRARTARAPSRAPRGPALALAPAVPTLEVPLGDIQPLADPTADVAPCVGCALRLSEPGQRSGGSPAGGGEPGGEGAGTAPLPLGGRISAPARLRYVDPVYPDLARRSGVQGAVAIECVIDAQGRVASARVVRGVPLLDAAALSAVQLWTYRPTLLNGVAVPVVMTVTVRFQLR